MFTGGRKLNFVIKNTKASNGITLQQAISGMAGTVYLGDNNVFLWTPQCEYLKAEEAVCDARFCPLDKPLADKFTAVTKGIFLPVKAVVLKDPKHFQINKALGWFDLVLIPSKKIKNTPQDVFKNRVLAYDAPEHIRNREL